MSDWRDIAGDQNLRLSQKLLEQQAEINELRAERDRALEVIRQAYEAGDDAWRVCANALHPTNPTRLVPVDQPPPSDDDDEPDQPSSRYVDDEADRAHYAALGAQQTRGERP